MWAGLGIENLIQFSPPPCAIGNRKDTPPLIVSALSEDCWWLCVKGKGRQPNPSRCVASNISSSLGVISMVSLSWVVDGDSPVIDDLGRIIDQYSPRTNLGNVTKRTKIEHSFGDIARELFHLFSDVTEEGIAWPSPHEHNCVNRYLAKVHFHRCSGSKGVCAHFVRFESKNFTSNCCACCS